MGLIKCPRCELNYMLDTDKMCSVCRREVRGESESYEMIELCSECGENPVVPGQELCAFCLKELSNNGSNDQDEENVIGSASNIGIDSVSTMDEIELDINDDMDNDAFADDDKELFGEDDEDPEEDSEEEL